MADYIAPSDVATFLNITLQSAGTNVLNQITPALCALVDRYCNRTWTIADTTEITEKFDGGVNVFMVGKPPIASIVSITDGDVPVDVSNYKIYDSYVKLDYVPAKDLQNIVIVYKTSANACPAPVKLALIQWAAQIFKDQNSGGKVTQSVSTGPVNVQYLTSADIPPFVKMVLDQYRIFDI